jgi:hypothetical protein
MCFYLFAARCCQHESPFHGPQTRKRRTRMLSSSHSDALQTKHAGIDARLREELGRPSPDAGTIQQLKRAKLRIKEELSEL